MYQNLLANLKGMTAEEYRYLEQVMNGMDAKQAKHFVMLYSSKRKDPQEILLFTLLGLLGFAGIQRFILNQIGMGILYFITLGLCFIGTIVDLVNHKSLTFEYNQRAAYESVQLVKMSNGPSTPGF